MKKIVTILLAVMCLFTLAACNNGGGSSEGGESGATEKASIKVGGSGPLTGGAALYGMAVNRGAQIAVDEINEKEGYEYFTLDFQDDAHDAEQAVNAFYKLMDDGMQVSLLCTTSAPAAAVAGLTQDEDIFAITPSGSRDDIPTYGSNIFQMCFTDSNQGTGSADYFATYFADKKIGIIYQSSVDYSKGIYQTFAAEAEKLGLNVVETQAFTDEKDFSVQIAKMKDAGAEVVFLPIYYDEASMILTQAGDYSPIWFGVDGMDGILGVENFDTSLAEGVYLLTPFAADATDDLTVSFVKKYNDLFGEVPMQFAADAYDAVYVLYNACKAGNVTADMSNSEISAILREQVTSMTFNGLTGSNITWDASGEVSKLPMAVIIENGAYVSAQ
ncbi:MAG: ABC transporter substrate-binding protein [Erysipelotrichaceae bacterium]|nr:ABC transporter substrate-binding protein [Erysipelotrichaceae bacterium]